MDKTETFDELAQLLAQENEIHQHLIDLATSINSSIRQDNIAQLQSASVSYDEHICRLEKVEERRVECCSSLQRMLGDLVPSSRFVSLVEHCSPQQRQKLEALKNSLSSSITELYKINTSNTLLLEETLGAIARTFDMIRESARQKSGYRYKGDRSRSSSGISMFNRVI